MEQNFKVMGLKKIWSRRRYEEDSCRELAGKFDIPIPIAAILLQRRLNDEARLRNFLNPSLDQLPPPSLMKGMDRAVSCMVRTIRDRSPVVIYADYDVDGAAAAALIFLFLKDLGIKAVCYQPNRMSEGYGLHKGALERLAMEIGGSGLLITVDCGISDQEEVKEAKNLGFTVIVTDHHLPPDLPPPADAILNPHQSGCLFPYKDLAGVGVAFYLLMGLRSQLRRENYWLKGVPNLKQYLDLVAMGTVSDMVPLTGPNRIFTMAGLEVMGGRKRPGLRHLMEVSGLAAGQTPTAYDIGFRLGPRINAAGRIGDPSKALELLTTDNDSKAFDLARDLDKENERRKVLEQKCYEEARLLADEYVGQEEKKTVVLSSENWHPGVLGIAAARLVKEFFKPAILLSIKTGQAKGSGRSIPALNLYEALTACADLLAGYGGHKAAAGLSLAAGDIERFKERFELTVASRLSDEDLKPALTIDAQLNHEFLTSRSFFRYYRRLEPFGVGNPEPVFALDTTGGQFMNPQVVGKNHLKFSWRHNGFCLNGIGFGLGHLAAMLNHETAAIAFKLRLNTYQGRESWEMNLIDINRSTTV